MLDPDGQVEGGPSPRGRGNRLPPASAFPPARTIPAWAGEPSTTARRVSAWRDHPRVGGGTRDMQPTGDSEGGPSPRGRGNLTWDLPSYSAKGTIPAWA